MTCHRLDLIQPSYTCRLVGARYRLEKYIKKVVLLNARGGIYSNSETAGLEMSVNYMRNVFAGIFGMEIVEEVVIEGHNANRAQASEIIESGIKKVAEVPGKLVRKLA